MHNNKCITIIIINILIVISSLFSVRALFSLIFDFFISAWLKVYSLILL